MSLTTAQQDTLRPVFESQLPTSDKVHYTVSFEPLGENDVPVVITQNEFMRRMKDMSAVSGGPYSFYGQMPDSFNVVINGNHPLVMEVLQETDKEVGADVKALDTKIDSLAKQKDSFDALIKDKKEEELTQEEKDKQSELNKKLVKYRGDKDAKLKEAGSKNKLVRQLVDLALLSNGMLKGENLTNFIRRSVEMIEK